MHDFFNNDVPEETIFILQNSENELKFNENEELEGTMFYQIKKKTYGEDEMESHVIQLIDITTSVKFRKLVGEHKLLEIINALVSHEMRNPLNAISAMIGRIKEQYTAIVQNIMKEDQVATSKKI